MAVKYRLFGSELSPYSVKVRSYLRYKKIPFDWVAKGYGSEDEFQSLARSSALPMLVSPKGGIAHDSSLILSGIEKRVRKPSACPTDKACEALSLLLEDYADEWLNKVMFHYRWSTAKAAKAAAKRQADHVFAGYEVENRAEIEKSIAKSMSGRLKLIGSTKKNGPLLEASFERFLSLLNAHLEHHLFLFGGHPSFADFALAGQLSQLLMEEASGELIREKAPFVTAWCEFMEDPRPGADFEPLGAVQDTLLPLIRDEVAITYVAWASANAESIAKKRKTATFKINELEFKQGTQAHTAASFENVKAGFAAVPAIQAIEDFLRGANLFETFPLGDPEAEQAEPEQTGSDQTGSDQSEPAASEEAASSSDAPEKAVVPDQPASADQSTPDGYTPASQEDVAKPEDEASLSPEEVKEAQAEAAQKTEDGSLSDTGPRPAPTPDTPDGEEASAEEAGYTVRDA